MGCQTVLYSIKFVKFSNDKFSFIPIALIDLKGRFFGGRVVEARFYSEELFKFGKLFEF
jgi:hypothetical protein